MSEGGTELSLFSYEEFRDPAYYARDLSLIQDALPELEWLTETPPYDTWHDDGVPPFASSWDSVISDLAGVTAVSEITPQLAEQSFDRFMTSGKFGTAYTFANKIRHMGLGSKEHWSEYILLSGLAYINLGLTEATLLPFTDTDETTGEVLHKSNMKPKHFLGVYATAMGLAEEFPDELAPYLEYADSLHMEMLRHYPYTDEYTHAMWKFWGSDPAEPQKQSIYERIKSRDDAWREQAASTLTSHIQTLMRQSGYYRAGVLINFGRSTDLVLAEFVAEQFLKAYDQMDLSNDVLMHIEATSSTFVPYKYPRLTNLKSMVRELWQSDVALRDELEAIMARREIETIQTILSKPETVNPDTMAMLKDEMATLARDLPDTDSQKKSILSTDTSEKFELAIQDVARAGATTIDRLIERHFMNLAGGIVDMDTLAIDIDRLEAAVVDDAMNNDVTAHTFERLIGYISPFARLGQSFVEQYISSDFIRTAQTVIDARTEHYKESKETADYYRQMREKLEQGPLEVFRYYWSHHEEYYS